MDDKTYRILVSPVRCLNKIYNFGEVKRLQKVMFVTSNNVYDNSDHIIIDTVDVIATLSQILHWAHLSAREHTTNVKMEGGE